MMSCSQLVYCCLQGKAEWQKNGVSLVDCASTILLVHAGATGPTSAGPAHVCADVLCSALRLLLLLVACAAIASVVKPAARCCMVRPRSV